MKLPPGLQSGKDCVTAEFSLFYERGAITGILLFSSQFFRNHGIVPVTANKMILQNYQE